MANTESNRWLANKNNKINIYFADINEVGLKLLSDPGKSSFLARSFIPMQVSK